MGDTFMRTVYKSMKKPMLGILAFATFLSSFGQIPMDIGLAYETIPVQETSSQDASFVEEENIIDEADRKSVV
jgi:hypothetical protein